MAWAQVVVCALAAAPTILGFVPQPALPTGAGRWVSDSAVSTRIPAADAVAGRWTSRSVLSQPVLQASREADVQFKSQVRPGGNSSMIISIDVPGSATKQCWDKAIKTAATKRKLPGFSGKRRVPEDVVVSMVGEDYLKSTAMEALADMAINNVIKEAPFRPIGQAQLLQAPDVLLRYFTPGEPMPLEIKVDVWPEVKFVKPYTGLDITVEEIPFDQERYDDAIKSLMERGVKVEDTPDDYACQMGDSLIADMFPFEENEDGTQGKALPELASGDEVEIVMTDDRYMPGLVEGLVGIKRGETRQVKVKFPDRLSTKAAALGGKKAVFDVKCLDIKKRIMPQQDDEFANSIRAGLTFKELQNEVLAAINDETDAKKKERRNKGIEEALVATAEVEIPDTLLVEQTRTKFAIMLAEMKDQGTPDEQIKSMINKEGFEKYKEVARKSTTRTLKLSLLFNELASKEGLEVDQDEIEDQLELMRAEAKGQEFDEKAAAEKIEATLCRELVLNWVAERSNVKYVEAAGVPTQT